MKSQASGRIAELERLASLKASGAISESEYESLKSQVLYAQTEPVRSSRKRRVLLGVVAVLVAVGVVGAVMVLNQRSTPEADQASETERSEPPKTVGHISPTVPQPSSTAASEQTIAMWMDEIRPGLTAFYLANDAFMSALTQQGTIDEIGTASVDVHAAVADTLPSMPASYPTSAEYNAWRSCALSVSAVVSEGYLDDDIDAMYQGITDWEGCEQLHEEWLTAVGAP